MQVYGDFSHIASSRPYHLCDFGGEPVKVGANVQWGEISRYQYILFLHHLYYTDSADCAE